MFDFDFRKYGGCWDEPDDRDFIADEIFGTVKEDNIPKECDLRVGTGYTPKNQGNSVMCTAFASVSCFEIMNRREHKRNIVFDPEKLWKYMQKKGLTSEKGASLQNAIKSLVRTGADYGADHYNSTGYAKVEKTFEGLAGFISRGFPIFTGARVTKTNYSGAKKTGVFNGVADKIIGGHAFSLVGFGIIPKEYKSQYAGEFGYIAINSYGNWGKEKDGSFWVPGSLIDNIYSSYVIYDEIDAKMIFADVAEGNWYSDAIKWAGEKKIAIGEGDAKEMKERKFSPHRPMTRAEFCVALKRYNDIKK